MNHPIAPLYPLVLAYLVSGCGGDDSTEVHSSTGEPAPESSSSVSATNALTSTDDTSTETGAASADASTSAGIDESSSSAGPTAFIDAQDDVLYAPNDSFFVVYAHEGLLSNDLSGSGAPTVTDFTAMSEAGGTVVVQTEGSLNYTPPAGFWGADGFTYEAGDGMERDQANVTIWVAPGDMGASELADSSGAFGLHGADADRVGNSVADAGDVNGDGWTDLVVGASNTLEGGAAYVVFGDDSMSSGPMAEVGDSVAGFEIVPVLNSERLGSTVGGAGDVNGDGLDDVLVDTTSMYGTYGDTGLAYVVFGKDDNEPVLGADIIGGVGGFAIAGESFPDQTLVSRIAAAGDVNGDGLADIVLGRSRTFDPFVGRAYVVFGKTDGDLVDLAAVAGGTGGFLLLGEGDADFAACSVAGAGDVDGDDLDDIVIGASRAGEDGRAYVVFGKADGDSVALAEVAAGNGGYVIEGTSAEERFGDEVRGVGDVDHDGLADVLVAAPSRSDPGLEQRGAAYVAFGKSDALPLYSDDLEQGDGGLAILGAQAGDRLGATSIDGGRDLNGDGQADFFVVAERTWDGIGPVPPHQAFVVYGTESIEAVDLADVQDGSGGFVLACDFDLVNGCFLTLAGLADFDGDGFDDLAIGSPSEETNGDPAGRAYVMYGIPTGPAPR